MEDTMSDTLTNILVHIVFSTKERRPLITPELKPQLHAYMGSIARALHVHPIAINGTDNHVHLLLRMPPTIAVSDLLRVLKANSSRWIRATGPKMQPFAWQSGFATFSVSQDLIPRLVDYIAHQETHHRIHSFTDEFALILKGEGLNFSDHNARNM
jgi:putative transposase